MSKYTTTKAETTLPVRESRIFPVHEGKGIIVTGATGGIGKAIVELLLAQGAKVVVADLREETVAATAASFGGAEKGCFGVAIDVASEAAVAAGVAKSAELLGRIDGLVNCAAIVLHSDPLAIPRADWQKQFEINLFGAYDMARLVARHMIDHDIKGAIVSIASEAGKKGHKESLAYSASKAAVISMTRMLSETLAPYDINVNCVCPGGVATPMLREVSVAYSGFTAEPAPAIFDKMLSQQLVRHLQPVEVARVTSFLLSDDAMLIRGQAVNADAGETPY
ncbi:SDR family NAD(P)-dependent oxidoreductase [Kaistia dalseonensis]|uniref:NAD(P)-dependent dehydrogenase (Short-subunit alcohol dehydrogenase family) n=1 Tax=Kaistia dalseonensis TaxID=410840 RepID=A0ABU0HCQ2_9HYPH|nr:SDR family oxidoreductase [Kaistia dalseonensis]MCX5496676.1 SDR family NAD(P)-dependent oxidoreductase [Kaistia dalseonensis]MDQ0439301.1 NAD(P)-dependent dehydrogenase (short-subunit alcohol dehydrogenase family) [Kaistia dalseonensis]